jgi:hypothetical protein
MLVIFGGDVLLDGNGELHAVSPPKWQREKAARHGFEQATVRMKLLPVARAGTWIINGLLSLSLGLYSKRFNASLDQVLKWELRRSLELNSFRATQKHAH